MCFTDPRKCSCCQNHVREQVKLMQEGVLLEGNYIILPGAINWVDELLPVLMGSLDRKEVVGTLTNIRREDGWVVGDVVMSIENPDWYEHGALLTQVSYADGDEPRRVLAKGTLRADVLLPKPATPCHIL